jgi:predicted ABC-type ATPase
MPTTLPDSEVKDLLSRLNDMQTKRRVASEAGVRKYRKPLGTVLGGSGAGPTHTAGRPGRGVSGRVRQGAGVTSQTAPKPLDEATHRDLTTGPTSAAPHIMQNEDGSHSFTPERTALHDQLLVHFLQGHAKSANPTFNVLGGGPAAGKSTMVNSGQVEGLRKPSVTVNADEFKELLPEYQHMMNTGDASAASHVHEESSYLAKRLTSEAMARGYDVTLDGTGDSSAKSMLGKIDAAKAHGYKVNGYYVTVPTDEAVRRADARGQETGRHVPETVIRTTHANVSQVLPQIHQHFDQVHLFDTEGNGVEPVVSSVNGNLTVHKQALWDAFLAKAHESTATKADQSSPQLMPADTMSHMYAQIALGVQKSASQYVTDKASSAMWDKLSGEVSAIKAKGGYLGMLNEIPEVDKPDPDTWEGNPAPKVALPTTEVKELLSRIESMQAKDMVRTEAGVTKYRKPVGTVLGASADPDVHVLHPAPGSRGVNAKYNLERRVGGKIKRTKHADMNSVDDAIDAHMEDHPETTAVAHHIPGHGMFVVHNSGDIEHGSLGKIGTMGYNRAGDLTMKPTGSSRNIGTFSTVSDALVALKAHGQTKKPKTSSLPEGVTALPDGHGGMNYYHDQHAGTYRSAQEASAARESALAKKAPPKKASSTGPGSLHDLHKRGYEFFAAEDKSRTRMTPAQAVSHVREGGMLGYKAPATRAPSGGHRGAVINAINAVKQGDDKGREERIKRHATVLHQRAAKGGYSYRDTAGNTITPRQAAEHMEAGKRVRRTETARTRVRRQSAIDKFLEGYR